MPIQETVFERTYKNYLEQFDALPMIPVVVLYNDGDEEFPATCSVLFESRAEKYLDAECIAMLGRQLFNRLKSASGHAAFQGLRIQ